MRKSNAILQAIKRARKAEDGSPDVPKTWEQMTVPDHFRRTVRNDQFLAVEESSGPDKESKILIFCSNEQKALLDGSDYWVADGTFEVVENTLFAQLFVIHALSPVGITVPCLYVLLPDKELSSYQRVFQYLRSEGVKQPGCFKADFEQGIYKAYRNVYPGAAVVLCDAHFKRALRRKLASLGLTSLYTSNESLQVLIRYIWGLSLAPIDQIVPLWEDFIRVKYEEMSESDAFEGEDEAVDEWIGYFERTYVGALNWRTGNRKQPLYPHEVWNKNKSILSDDPTTTNSAEGYNNALKSSLPRNNSIWTLLKQLQKEENSNHLKLRDVALGQQNNQSTSPNSSRNLARAQRQQDLKGLVSNFANMSTKMWMASVVDFYNS